MMMMIDGGDEGGDAAKRVRGRWLSMRKGVGERREGEMRCIMKRGIFLKLYTRVFFLSPWLLLFRVF